MTPGTEILRARALAERQPVILPPEGTRNGDPFCKVYPQEPGIRVWVSAAMYVRQVDSGKKMPASGAGKQALTACTPSAKFYNFRQQAVCFRKSTEYVGYPRHSRNRSLSGR
jgi:hypothetical protein